MYAVIIAGGLGTRLGHLTVDLPKCLVPIAGVPILDIQVEMLKRAGVTDVILALGYRAQQVVDHTWSRDFGVKFYYSVETKLLGRGGAVAKALQFVPWSRFPVLVMNGDVLTDEDPSVLFADFKQRESELPLMNVLITQVPSPYGLVHVSQETGHVIGFFEKASEMSPINAGMYLVSRDLQEYLPTTGDWETETFPRVAGLGLMTAVETRKFWRSIDSPGDVLAVEKHLEDASSYLGKIVRQLKEEQ